MATGQGSGALLYISAWPPQTSGPFQTTDRIPGPGCGRCSGLPHRPHSDRLPGGRPGSCPLGSGGPHRTQSSEGAAGRPPQTGRSPVHSAFPVLPLAHHSK